jgi:predicted nuclease of restriction endonuclease-like (RecB) superfamily
VFSIEPKRGQICGKPVSKMYPEDKLCRAHKHRTKEKISKYIYERALEQSTCAPQLQEKAIDNVTEHPTIVQPSRIEEDNISLLSIQDEDKEENQEFTDLEDLVKYLEQHFDKRYKVNNTINSSNNNNSTFNMQTIIGLIVTSMLPIMLKKFTGNNNIGNVSTNTSAGSVPDANNNISKNTTASKTEERTTATNSETTQITEILSNENNSSQKGFSSVLL